MSLTADQQGALDLHNAARAAVGSPPLVWDTGLQAAAQQWADHMAQAQDFNHDPNAGAGENIFFGSPPGPEIQRWAANDWIGEKAQYHGGGFTEATGHYTQCVWDTTTNVGIADNNGYVCARYSPAGNVDGQVAYPQDANGNPTNVGGSGPPPGGNGPSGPNGLLFLNAFNGGNWKSAIGWYPRIQNVVGTQPAVLQDRAWVPWEGSTQCLKFPNGDDLQWTINKDAQSQADFSQCGTAKNNEQAYTVYKDDKHAVFEKDGWTYTTIYYLT